LSRGIPFVFNSWIVRHLTEEDYAVTISTIFQFFDELVIGIFFLKLVITLLFLGIHSRLWL